MQSLAQEIHAFSKCNLRKQSTHVTTLGGKRVIEKCQGATVEESVDPGNVCGYVQDNSLDLQVGVVGPYLLIASQDVAQDFDALRKFKVSHILNVAYGVGNTFPDLFIYKKLNILDLPETDITSYFKECSQFIDDVKAENGTVLVHCNAGVSRSAAIVIGYLMSRKGLRFEEAYALVKTARPAICPNRGFLEQLKSYKPQGDVRVGDITPD